VSKSLQDQLLALGLAKDKVKQSSRPKPHGKKHSEAKRPGPNKPGSGRIRPAAKDLKAEDNISLEQAYRIRDSVEKTEKQKARERKMEEDRKRAALNRQIRQIVDAHRLNLAEAEQARFFMYKERIRKVHVSAEQFKQLNEGLLGVVYLGGGYHILGSEQIEAVRKISPEHIPDLLAGDGDDEELWEAFEKSANAAEADEAKKNLSEPAATDLASELDDASGEPSKE
jgi:uncharacterized protein YaiL (DUF2058 family)